MFRCEMICDSLAPNGRRLSTMELTYPRFIHSEVLTHRDRARNSGSSRAIPWVTMCEAIQNDPVIPIYWGKNQKGMQTGEEINYKHQDLAREIWIRARDFAIKQAQALNDLGIHKSLCNRLTEPFMWITVVMTATEWKNFFRLRVHKDAEIHMQKIAMMMKETYEKSKPDGTTYHLPYIQDDDWDKALNFQEALQKENYVPLDTFDAKLWILKRVSVARCARVSYVQHGSKVKEISNDLNLFYNTLKGNEIMHASPFEHAAIASKDPKERSGPFIGWNQFRKEFIGENVEG